MSIDFLQSKRANYNVIGTICKELDILREEKYIINPEDFPNKTLEIIFSAIYELAYGNADLTEVTPIDIDNYLSNYPEYYKIFESGKGFEYVVRSIDTCNPKLFDKYFNELKKFSLLRMYYNNGFDVRLIYNYDEEDIRKRGEEFDKLMKMSESDIVKEVSLNLISIQEKWNVHNIMCQTAYQAGEQIDENMDALVEEGEIGLSYSSIYYNSLFLGAVRGKFLLRSADTGSGKTRWFVADACEFSCSHKYDEKLGWVEIGQNSPTLFICTELDLQELQILMIAYLTGIATRKLKLGKLTALDKGKVEKAKKIIQNAPLYIEELEDGDINDINMLINKHIMKYNVRNVIFDYIENTPKMCRSIAEMYGIASIREDQVLQNFTNFFKGFAKKFNIFVESGTQLNREPIKNANALAGGKGTARKVDFGIIVGFATDEELAKVKGHIESSGKTPNYAHHCYKNRGAGESNIILWMNTNLGNMREEFCFATDYRYNRVEIQGMEITPTKVESKEVEEPFNPFNISSGEVDF